MRFEIVEHDPDVEIHIQQTGERASQLLASLQDCQQGHCGPTDQYDRLENMTVHAEADQLTIRLQPRAGQHLDTDQLQECLDYALEHTEPDTD